jgi:hypothetical protein
LSTALAQIVAHAGGMPGLLAIPLAGEDVAFTREEKTEIYKVLSVRHHYEGFPRPETQVHCW